MWSTALNGTVTGLALIIAIGAQNAFVLRQGIRREYITAVVAICIASDAVLIAAGTAGIGAIVDSVPWLLTVLRWAGAAYLLWFAISSIRSAIKPGVLTAEAPRSAGSVAATAVALTWLNPHVYLDTVLFLGSMANQHGPDGRWVYATGAIIGSIIWFTALGFGARALARPLADPKAWRVLDLIIAAVMIVLAFKLAFF